MARTKQTQSPPAVPAWLVSYRHGRAPAVPWLVVTDVPTEVKRPAVEDALSGWSGWDRFPVAPGGRTSVRKLGLDEAMPAVGSVSWAAVLPAERSLTVRVPGADHSAMTRAARAAGVSLHEWALSALLGAVTASAGVSE